MPTDTFWRAVTRPYTVTFTGGPSAARVEVRHAASGARRVAAGIHTDRRARALGARHLERPRLILVRGGRGIVAAERHRA